MLRNYWYIACSSRQLAESPHGAQVLDQEIVVFRDSSAKPHALLNRCCHRGVELSLGKVIEGTIACRYHGWRYAGNGQCVHIPSLSSGRGIPEGVGVPRYPCVEQDGYIWVWVDKREANPARPPRIPQFANYRWHQGSMPMQCGVLKGIENNLDWCHPYFAHPWTHGQFFNTRFRGFRDQSYEMRRSEQGLVVFTPVTANEEEPIPEQPLIKLTFDLPNRVRAEFWKPFHLVIVMHFVPTGNNTCRFEWLISKLLPIGSRVSWRKWQPRIFLQDQSVLESAQRWYDREGDNFERSVDADASTLLVRQIVTMAESGNWEEKRSSLPLRKVVTVRA